jgi:hypothetical protein
MKTSENFHTFDVADSMAAAASRLNVPLEKVKKMKRAGCAAFKGSRVYLRELSKEIEASEKTSALPVPEILMVILEEAVTVIASKKHPPKETFNLTSAMQVGFAVSILVLEPEHGDEFLRRSAKLCERIVGVSSQKAAASRSIEQWRRNSQSKKLAASE